MIRVAIADDQALVRAGFAALIDDTDDLTIVGQAADGNDAIQLAAAARPDVMLMDIRMPTLDGIAATRAIVERHPHVRIIVLTTFELDDYVFAALRAGASGFLTKDVDPDQLRSAIRHVADGHALLSPSVTRRVIDTFATTTPTDPQRLGVLTEREIDVLRLVATGLSNDEIAQQLIISPLTAKTHVSRLLTKLAARDRVHLVITAYETGLTR